MEKQTKKMLNMPKLEPKTLAVLAGCGVVIAVLIALCISILMQTNMQREYTGARDRVGDELYTQLYMLCQTFDQVGVPGQDVENTLIPQMKNYYLSAQTLNGVLNNAFDPSYNVLTPEVMAAMDRAFEAYDSAFRGGKTTEEAEAAMLTCMNMLRDTLNTRYPNGRLKAA